MRHPDWPERLYALVAAAHSRPFVWGEHDCCLFAANAVKALTGDDYTGLFPGKYSTARGASRILKKHGGVRGIATAALGDGIPPMTAQRGDVVLYESINGEALGICVGSQFVATGTEGLLYRNMKEALIAWRVK